ncbi:MAG: hypothetical protein HKN33_07755 [Pyrinomonadaceae bacterium]|nr:hypothetical protein [Pyrinomonadaceae bacterium]
MLALFVLTLPISGNSVTTEKVRISGEVTNIRKVQGKWIGRARFTGRTSDGARYKGSGPATIRFNRGRTAVTRMVIRFEGTRNGKPYSGTMSCYQKITFEAAVGSSFEFSQVAAGAAPNGI